jgi:hypothetical protein
VVKAWATIRVVLKHALQADRASESCTS